MVVLSRGSWVNFKIHGEDRVGKVDNFIGRAVMIEHEGGIYQRYPDEFTPLPEGLNQILLSSISQGELNE
jgi:hypothetical protein